MDEDFALLDFALVDAAPEIVVAAFVAAHEAASDGSTNSQRKGLMGRLFGAKRGASGNAPLTLHAADSLPSPPFTRADISPPPEDTLPVRLSYPVGDNGLTLIEFVEPDIGTSRVIGRLSAGLPGTDVFYFRYSGVRHPGADFSFHVYSDGKPLRRVGSLSLKGDGPDAKWSVTDSGIPHTTEADSLPHPKSPPNEIMTPERQGSILDALGVDPGTLFDSVDTLSTVVVLSSASGGRPVSELQTAPQSFAPAAEDIPEPEPELPEAAAAAPVEEAEPAPDWETQVTGILLDAVNAGLPEAEQVAWLDALTRKLESGDVEQALQDAMDLIAAGDRPDDQKTDASTRLQTLYAHMLPPEA
jgi:hypothetical protein